MKTLNYSVILIVNGSETPIAVCTDRTAAQNVIRWYPLPDAWHQWKVARIFGIHTI